MIPWEEIESKYAEPFSTTGAPAISARIALGSLIIKEKLALSDRETVEQIRENPYLQYFLGYRSYQDETQPFDPSMMVHFRKRFAMEDVGAINESILQQVGVMRAEKHSDDEDPPKTGGTLGDGADQTSVDGRTDETPSDMSEENSGKLLVDASCAPADIRYPTDLSILNEAREKTEAIIDELHVPDIGKKGKPRTYRQKARKGYLAVAKKRKPTRKSTRKAIGKQLRYLRRNLGHIKALGTPERLSLLSSYQYRCLLVINEVYRQQEEMYGKRKHTVSDRIVSIRQPHVRPIIRGKAGRPVEFGAKMSLANVNGLVYLDRFSWDAYNEGGDLPGQVEAYRRRHGHYPESVHADGIYRTRANLRYCKERNIRLSGPPLGKPKKDPAACAAQRNQARQDERDRIPIEGSFGTGKRRYSLDRILERGADTSATTIAIILLVMNLETLLRRFLSLFSWLIRKVFGVTRAVLSSLFPRPQPFCSGWDGLYSGIQ
jgi:hypothetical protein